MLGDFNATSSNQRLTFFQKIKIKKVQTCFKSSIGLAIDLILTNNSYLYKKSQSFETGISNHHYLIFTMVKSKYERMPPKTITYRSHKYFTELLKEAIRSDCSYIEGENLIEKRFDQFAPMKKIVLRGNNKPHMTSQLRQEKKRSRIKNKANKSGKIADKRTYKTQGNLVVKLNKKAKNSFLKNQTTENPTNKTKMFWKLCKPFFTEKGFRQKQKFTLKTKRRVTSSETAITNIFNNYFVNITKSLNIPEQNAENYQNNTDLEKTLEMFESHPSVRHIKKVTSDTKFSFQHALPWGTYQTIMELNKNKTTS